MSTYLSPAKVNLWLRILGCREDGFHEIETRMCPVDIYDQVTVTPKEAGIRITCSDPELPTGNDNLVWKAAEAFFQATGSADGVAIHLDKKIPSGAGLAGGSGNAATALSALNANYGDPLKAEKLAALAASIGSDVVFFLNGGVCDCQGRGEVVTPVAEPMPSLPLLLIRPAFGVSTPWAYRRWKESKELPGINYAPQAMPWGIMSNDLERPVFAKHLVLPEIKAWLAAQSGVRAALMSGSGSTVFAVLEDPSVGEALEPLARERYGEPTWIRRCSTLTNSPFSSRRIAKTVTTED